MKAVLPALTFGFAALAYSITPVSAQSPYQSSSDFAKYAMKLRESALTNVEPRVIVPTTQRPLSGGKYPWRTSIITTVFWAGEAAAVRNPVHNRSSSWDVNWAINYGGYDDPDPSGRKGYFPAKFIPRQNPFYVALPYNDVTRGTTKPESRFAIPWFKQAFEREGKSVCRDRWVAVRKGNRVAYAQWSDCGPFRTDHWQYVFGDPRTGQWERPKPNLNKGAGLDVSPAVRDYLGMSSTDITDWKFVEFREVPKGPWSQFGDNNTFVQIQRGTADRVAMATSSGGLPMATGARSRAERAPTILTK
jgi:hypothetical protein